MGTSRDIDMDFLLVKTDFIPEKEESVVFMKGTIRHTAESMNNVFLAVKKKIKCFFSFKFSPNTELHGNSNALFKSL